MPLLISAFEMDPQALGGEPSRSATYWLGQAYQRAGSITAARAVWRTGLERGLEVGSLDVASADSYLRTSGDGLSGEDRLGATIIFLEMLRQWGQPIRDDLQPLVERHVARALQLLPHAVASEFTRRSNPGIELALWWARQDPMPASAANELVLEHLERVAFALETFPDPRSATGYDARGSTWVRLGAPARRRAIEYFTPRLTQRVHDLRVAGGNSLLVSPSSFAPSEVWFYHGDEPYHFFFVQDGRRYRLGEVTDIIPPHLRSAVDGQSGRGGAKADIVLEAYRAVYEQLAPFHIDYVQRLHDVDSYLGHLEDIAQRDGHLVAEAEVSGAFRRADYSAAVNRSGSATVTNQSPALAAQGFITAARRQDASLREEQLLRVPDSRSDVLDGIELLDVATRLARFLDPSGHTRVEVYWAPYEGSLALSGTLHRAALESGWQSGYDHVIRASLVRNRPDVLRSVESVSLVSVPGRRAVTEELLSPQTLMAHDVQPGDALAVQWDQVLANLSGDPVALGPQVRLSVLRTEQLQPLLGDGRLEMSDLKPVTPPTLEPFPFGAISPRTPLALYFEAYGLLYGPDDSVDLRVDYEVTLSTGGGILRRARTRTTAGNLITAIDGTRTEQYLILNPGEWSDADQVHIVVSVTDRTSGRVVSRTIDFTVADD